MKGEGGRGGGEKEGEWERGDRGKDEGREGVYIEREREREGERERGREGERETL